jgi:hypothetical protein
MYLSRQGEAVALGIPRRLRCAPSPRNDKEESYAASPWNDKEEYCAVPPRNNKKEC